MTYIFERKREIALPGNLEPLAERWTVPINQINHHELRYYPDAFFSEMNGLIQQTQRIVDPDPLEQDLLHTSRMLAETGELKLALFKLHEAIDGRLER